MVWSAVIQIEHVNETDIPPNIHCLKITTENGKQYSWWSFSLMTSKYISSNWTNHRTFNDTDINKNKLSDASYNIEIIHNFEGKAMVNIMKGKKNILRQEVNLWANRHANEWLADL